MLTSAKRENLEHSLRTAVAATVSLGIARLLHLSEPQWAAISTMVVTQSTLGAALTISGERFAGTALGAAAGGLLGTYFGTSLMAFGLGVLALGLLCGVLRLDRAAYRFAGITLAIVMLVAREHVWTTAVHRFLEVSLGILAGLAVTALWPQRSQTAKPKAS